MSEVYNAAAAKAKILAERNTVRLVKIQHTIRNLRTYYQKLLDRGCTRDIQQVRSVANAIQKLETMASRIVTDSQQIQLEIQARIDSVFVFQNPRSPPSRECAREREEEDLTETCNVIYRKYLLPDDVQVTCFVDTSRCKRCMETMVYQASTSLCVCPSCGFSQQIMQCESSELIEYKGRTRKNTYSRVPLYGKFVKQFSKASDPLDAKTLSSLLKHIRNKHSEYLKVAKPTPIANFLRSERMGSLMHCALRICKTLNAEPVPLFDDPLIDCLCDRFAILSAVLKDMDLKDKKKIMNFEYITKQFLLMEKKKEMADCFLNHKTRDIVVEADLRIFLCCEHINRLLDTYEEKNGLQVRNRGICMAQAICGEPTRSITWHQVASVWYENGFQGKLKKVFRNKLENSFQIFKKNLESLEEVDEEVYGVLSKYTWLPYRTC